MFCCCHALHFVVIEFHLVLFEEFVDKDNKAMPLNHQSTDFRAQSLRQHAQRPRYLGIDVAILRCRTAVVGVLIHMR